MNPKRKKGQATRLLRRKIQQRERTKNRTPAQITAENLKKLEKSRETRAKMSPTERALLTAYNTHTVRLKRRRDAREAAKLERSMLDLSSSTDTFGSSTTDSSDDEEVPSVPSLNLTDEIRAQRKVDERLASQKTLSQKSTNDRGKYQDDELSSPGSMFDDPSSLLDSDSDAQWKENVKEAETTAAKPIAERRRSLRSVLPTKKRSEFPAELLNKPKPPPKKIAPPPPPATEQRRGSAPAPQTETQFQPLSQVNEEGGIAENYALELSPDLLAETMSEDEDRLSLVKSPLLISNRRDGSLISSTPLTVAKERLARGSEPVLISPVQKVGGNSMKNLILTQKLKEPNPLRLRRTAAIAASAAKGGATPVPGRKSLSDSFSAEGPVPQQKSKKTRMSVAPAPTTIRAPSESNISENEVMDVDEIESEIPASSPKKRIVTKTTTNQGGGFFLPPPRTSVKEKTAPKSKRDMGPGRRTVINSDDDDGESETEQLAEAAIPTKRARVRGSSQERRIFAPSGSVVHNPMIKKSTIPAVEAESEKSPSPPPQHQQQQKLPLTSPPIQPVSESVKEKKNKKEKRLSEAQQMEVEPNIMSTPETVTVTAKKKKSLSPQPLEEPKKAVPGPGKPGASIQEVGEPGPVSSSPKPKRPRISLSAAEPVVEQKRNKRHSEVDQVVEPTASPETATVGRRTVQKRQSEQREEQAVVASAPPPPSPSKKQPSTSVSAKQSRRKKCKCLLV